MRRARMLVLALLLVMLTAAGGVRAVDTWWFGAGDVGSRADLPAGWRWESYGGLELAVPGDWGWDDSSLRVSAWCVGPDDAVERPIVGRPGGIVPAIHCGDHDGSIANLGWLVGFDDAPGHADGVDHERDTSTIWLDGVEVVLAAPAVLRKRIAETIHRVRVDSAGCPVTHPITGQPRLRPTPATDVTTLRAVTTVSACRYRLRQVYPYPSSSPPLLFSSLRLDETAIQLITQAPVGGGPNFPHECAPEATDGTYAMVLRVRSAAGLTEIMLRFAGCDHNGFDDGVTVRTLTPATLAHFMTGPNHSISGEHWLFR
jgi:hypothetical protein